MSPVCATLRSSDLSFVCTQISRRTHRIQTSQDTFTGCISMNIYMYQSSPNPQSKSSHRETHNPHASTSTCPSARACTRARARACTRACKSPRPGANHRRQATRSPTSSCTVTRHCTSRRRCRARATRRRWRNGTRTPTRTSLTTRRIPCST